MRRIEFFRTASFRWTIAFAAIFVVAIGLLTGFIYWQTTGYLIRRVDRELQEFAEQSVPASPGPSGPLQSFFNDDPRQVKIAGLFAPDGRPLAGNLSRVPPGLPPLGVPGGLKFEVATGGRVRLEPLRVLARRLPDGRLLVLGRGVSATHEIDEIVTAGLLLVLVPSLLLALAIGIFISRGTLERIADFHRSSRLIMAGEMSRRLPVRGTDDDFDKLARIVNEMLDEIERLMAQAKGTGEDIAHDLRTPLTRLRGRLERSLARGPLETNLQASLSAAMEDIDQLLGTIGAILRIAEVDHGQRRAAFRQVDLADVVREALDLYEPFAEQKGISLELHAQPMGEVRGDGDLLFEAVANLIDNAIKFTPPGGQVRVMMRESGHGPLIRVADSGPGIAPEDFPKVLGRFYRADPSRNTVGTGLGLSLVASIARLHGFGLALCEQPAGCCIEIRCWAQGQEVMRTGAAASTPVSR